MLFIYRYLLLTVGLITCLSAQAFTIEPFSVRYHIYRGNIYVADSKFNLTKDNSEWIWKMNTEPRGIYSWLTKKKPFAETIMQNSGQDIKLLQENTGDYPKKPAKQHSWFDYANRQIYYLKGKKISHLKLAENVYNYHSIHLLYPQMLEQDKTHMNINFYKRGKLKASTLTLEKQVELPSSKKRMLVDKITQKFPGSEDKLVYYYQGKTLAPLKIEKFKPGTDTSVMWRIDDK